MDMGEKIDAELEERAYNYVRGHGWKPEGQSERLQRCYRAGALSERQALRKELGDLRVVFVLGNRAEALAKLDAILDGGKK